MIGRSGVLAAALAAALALGACGADVVPGVGSDDSDTADGRRAKAVVERFAEADGPEACDMMTPSALRNVYGKDEPPGPPPMLEGPPPEISLAECRRRSERFGGQEIDVRKVDVTGSRVAKVEATTDGGDRTFSVTVRHKGDAWLVDEIREK